MGVEVLGRSMEIDYYLDVSSKKAGEEGSGIKNLEQPQASRKSRRSSPALWRARRAQGRTARRVEGFIRCAALYRQMGLNRHVAQQAQKSRDCLSCRVVLFRRLRQRFAVNTWCYVVKSSVSLSHMTTGLEYIGKWPHRGISASRTPFFAI